MRPRLHIIEPLTGLPQPETAARAIATRKQAACASRAMAMNRRWDGVYATLHHYER